MAIRPAARSSNSEGKVLRKIVGSQNWMTDQVIRDVETLLTRGS